MQRVKGLIEREREVAAVEGATRERERERANEKEHERELNGSEPI